MAKPALPGETVTRPPEPPADPCMVTGRTHTITVDLHQEVGIPRATTTASSTATSKTRKIEPKCRWPRRRGRGFRTCAERWFGVLVDGLTETRVAGSRDGGGAIVDLELV